LTPANAPGRGTAAQVFATLAADWPTTARRSEASRSMAVWQQACPPLASFNSPGDVVDAINRSGDSNRSCAPLGELLVLAGEDPMAARAVLQAVIPGPRASVARRWAKTAAEGPWQSQNELAIDALSAAWEAIQAHAGQQHPRPAAVIVRVVEGALRHTHTRWTHRQSKPVLPPRGEPSQSAIDAAFSPEQHAARLIFEAQNTGVITAIEATILTRIGVYGCTAAATERDLGLGAGSMTRSLRRARDALHAWLNTLPVADRFVSKSVKVALEAPEPKLGKQAPQQLRLSCDKARSIHPDIRICQAVARAVTT
jgi:hypothetical protein